jgi:hypothetical protein
MDLTDFQRALIRWAQSEADNPSQDWPGFPLVQLPESHVEAFRGLVAHGHLVLVAKTKPHPLDAQDLVMTHYAAPAPSAAS